MTKQSFLSMLLGVAVALGSIAASGSASAQAPRGPIGHVVEAPSRGAKGAIAQNKRTGAMDRREVVKPAQVKRLEPAPTRGPVDKLQQSRAKSRARR